jgi:hypothetical protein
MDERWNFILDLYVANTGQSAARDANIDLILTMRTRKETEDFYQSGLGIGPLLITTQGPWHYTFDLGLPTNTTVYEGLPKPGQAPKTAKTFLMPIHDIAISLKGKMTFTTVFRETVTAPVNMAATFADETLSCWDFLQLQKGVPIIQPAEISRVQKR